MRRDRDVDSIFILYFRTQLSYHSLGWVSMDLCSGWIRSTVVGEDNSELQFDVLRPYLLIMHGLSEEEGCFHLSLFEV